MNRKAPLFIRVNSDKVPFSVLVNRFSKRYQFAFQKVKDVPNSIMFNQNPNISLYDIDEYKKGYFEIQDLNS